MRVTVTAIDDVEQLFAALESLLEERHENLVLFFFEWKNAQI